MSDNQLSILIISSLTRTTTANYIASAFRELGFETYTCSDRGVFTNQDIQGINSVDVHKLCIDHNIQPSLVLFIEGGTMQILPIGLEKVNCITAWYGIDTHMDYEKHLIISRLFDVTFIAQKEYVEKLKLDGIKQSYWLPLGFAPELLPRKTFERNINIAHVGSVNVSMNPHRHSLITLLKDNFKDTQFGLASPQQMGELYSRSKIVFNKSVKNDINMRFFEAMGTGAVLVTDPILGNGLEELFEKNKHYVAYEGDDHLVPIISELLSNPKKLGEISHCAQSLVLEKHTYRHRAESILQIIKKAQKISSAKPLDYAYALLTLKLYGAALSMLAFALRENAGQGGRKYLAYSISFALKTLSIPITFFEKILNKLAK